MTNKHHPMILKVGYKTFKIIHEDLTDYGAYGYTDMATHTIGIHKNQLEADYKGTLLHEILHVGYEVFALGADSLPRIKNEQLVSTTSNMLQVLHGLNPKLFKYIFS
jgi:hypothetical protein